MPDTGKDDVVLDENHKSVSWLNLDGRLSVSFALYDLSNSLSDGSSGILSEDRTRVIGVPVIVVSRGGELYPSPQQRDEESG